MTPTNKLRWLKHRYLYFRWWWFGWNNEYRTDIKLQQWWEEGNTGEWRDISVEELK